MEQPLQRVNTNTEVIPGSAFRIIHWVYLLKNIYLWVVWALEGPSCANFFDSKPAFGQSDCKAESGISELMFTLHRLVGTSLLSGLDLEVHLEVCLL